MVKHKDRIIRMRDYLYNRHYKSLTDSEFRKKLEESIKIYNSYEYGQHTKYIIWKMHIIFEVAFKYGDWAPPRQEVFDEECVLFKDLYFQRMYGQGMAEMIDDQNGKRIFVDDY